MANAKESVSFIVIAGTSHFGPFRTADAAAKWAAKSLSGAWQIVPLFGR